MPKALQLQVSNEKQAQFTCPVCGSCTTTHSLDGISKCGKLPGERKHHPSSEECALSHWRPGESCDKSLRLRKSRGDRMEPVGEMSIRQCLLNSQRWRRTSWGSASKRAGLVVSRHHLAHSDLGQRASPLWVPVSQVHTHPFEP